MDKTTQIGGRHGRFLHPFHYRGVTVPELIVVISLTGLLSVATIPSFTKFTLERRINSAVNALYTDLFFARTEALKRWQFVVVCRSLGGENCDGEAWSYGWIVFVDENRNNQRDETESVLKTQQRFANSTGVKFGAATPDNLRYRPDGTGWPNGTFTFCDRRGPDAARAVIFFQNGRPRISRTRSDGTPLDCSWFPNAL